MNSILTQSNDEPRSDVDGVLRDFFQAEMPRAWPKFTAPKPARLKTTGSWFARNAGRVALAACVALLLTGYLTLASFVPALRPTGGVNDIVPPISMKDNGAPKTVTPHDGNDHAVPMENGAKPRRSK